jgi:transcriptional regulator with XRE-family HTH domain/tetratricopeptide (TPR) repeat protein
MAAKRGRPATPLDADASSAAWLGAEIRRRRHERGWTLGELAEHIGYSLQHVSEVERAKAAPSAPFVAACDRILGTRGRLLDLLPAVEHDRAIQRHERDTARRAGLSGVRCEATHGEGDEDVDPVNRRGLLGAGAAVALGGPIVGSTPAAAREIDPELPAHWGRLLAVLDQHDAMHGPREVLDTVRHELRLIAEHRRVARGDLRTELLRVEAHWTEFAAFLTNDTGDWQDRDSWTERAIRLGLAADDPDIVALALMRRAQWAVQRLDARRAIAFAEDALCTPGTSAQARARCAVRAAHGHALANDAASCERLLANASEAADAHTTSPGAVTPSTIRANEARCWAWMKPQKAIALYDEALREWPRDQMRDGGLHQARLALACAAAGEHDRAKAEGRKALAIARLTKSSMAARELKRLRDALATL